MKKTAIALCALAAAFTLFGCKEEKAKTPEAAALISAAGVGIFQLGKSIPLDSKDYTFEGEHCFEECEEWDAYWVHQDGQQVLTIQINIDFSDIAKSRKNNIIRGISVSSNKFATAEGVRVGSAAEEFAKAYPKSAVSFSEYSGEYTISSEDKNSRIYAALLPESFAEPKDRSNLKLSDVKGAKIQSIGVAVPIQAEQETEPEEAPEALVLKTAKGEMLQEKDGVYYLNDKPFTGKAYKDITAAKEEIEYQVKMYGLSKDDFAVEWEMKDGKFHGKHRYDWGTSGASGSYKNGKIDGEWSYWNESVTDSKGSYKDGEKDGKWEYFDGNGDVYRIETYKNGKLIKTEEPPRGGVEQVAETCLMLIPPEFAEEWAMYAADASEIFERAGIKSVWSNSEKRHISFQIDGQADYVFDTAERETVNGVSITALLYKKGKKPMPVDIAIIDLKEASKYLGIDINKFNSAEASADTVELKKLQKKDGVYYLNDKPFSGIATDVNYDLDATYEWEMKDGKFHGKYQEWGGGYMVSGNYKDGKKHGEWKNTDDGSGNVTIEKWENDALASKSSGGTGNNTEASK